MKEILLIFTVWVVAVEMTSGTVIRGYRYYVNEAQLQIDRNICEELLTRMSLETNIR